MSLLYPTGVRKPLVSTAVSTPTQPSPSTPLSTPAAPTAPSPRTSPSPCSPQAANTHSAPPVQDHQTMVSRPRHAASQTGASWHMHTPRTYPGRGHHLGRRRVLYPPVLHLVSLAGPAETTSPYMKALGRKDRRLLQSHRPLLFLSSMPAVLSTQGTRKDTRSQLTAVLSKQGTRTETHSPQPASQATSRADAAATAAELLGRETACQRYLRARGPWVARYVMARALARESAVVRALVVDLGSVVGIWSRGRGDGCSV